MQNYNNSLNSNYYSGVLYLKVKQKEIIRQG